MPMRIAEVLLLGCAVYTTALSADGSQTHPADPNWIEGDAAPAQEKVSLVVAVHENLPGLTEAVDRLSDPRSPGYGNWLSLEEVNERWSDHKARIAVHEYLLSQKDLVVKTVGGGAFFHVEMPVKRANELLEADFREFKSTDGSKTIYRSRSIRLPESVAWAVDSVEYATKMPSKMAPRVFSSKVAGGSGDANPNVIQEYYGIKDPSVTNEESSNCVFETIGQSIVKQDVEDFCSNYNIPPQSFTIKGPNNPSSCSNPNNCIESTLDVQVIVSNAQDGTANGVDLTTWWSVPGSESFLQWILAVSQDPNPPWVHSISYGEPETRTGRSQDDSFDKALQKIALRGVSVLVSSGDDGVAGAGARTDPSQCGFTPSYPATARHVTAVGATMGPETGANETACTSDRGGGITTGGGFSTIFDRPSYQESQVADYLATATKLPPKSMFSYKNRAYPDVATMGHNYPIVIGGQTYHGSGTSASSPLFAAMITLANDARLNAGKKTLGWLNPVLYSLDASAFRNITVGENNCAAGGGQQGPPTCCQYGFTDQAGWAPVTGLGAPRFPSLLSQLTALP
jgi:tripeptidyl-peptidase-1